MESVDERKRQGGAPVPMAEVYSKAKHEADCKLSQHSSIFKP